MTLEVAQQVLETDRRLSECLLWRLQEDFYRQAGIGAWNTIPFYPTCNAFIGKTYAELIIHFLLDYQVHLKPFEPVYLIEMASGSGAFSFYVLTELALRIPYFESLQKQPLVYVMTDFAENNVRSWEENPKFARFRETGMLDFAVFRPEGQETLWLRGAQRELSAKSVKNPLIAIANYFFDSIRNDVFLVDAGSLKEGRVTFTRPLPPGGEGQPLEVEQLRQSISYHPVDADYYEDPRLNRILRQYRDAFDKATVLFPIGTFRCLRNLQTLSNHNLILISSDKGFTYQNYMVGHWEPQYALHGGCFSYSVNYHSLGLYFQNEGGRFFATSSKNLSVATVMGILVSRPDCLMERTRYYFTETVEKENPINYLFFVQSLVRADPEPKEDFNACLSLLRLCNHDAVVFHYIGGRLLNILDQIDLWQREALLESMTLVNANFFAVRKSLSALRWLGLIYYELRCHKECVEAFQQSMEIFGADEIALYHIAACHEVWEDYDAAYDYYEQTLALDPGCRLTQHGLERMAKQLDGLLEAAAEPTVETTLHGL